MDSSFFGQWFKGFEQALDGMEPGCRSNLLRCCARRCADTGVLQKYLELYRDTGGDRDTFYSRLSELGGVRAEIVIPQREYYIYFPECGCDLHKDCGVNTPALCECSRQSIIYVAQSVWTDSRVCVETMNTVLAGDNECKFRLIFDK